MTFSDNPQLSLPTVLERIKDLATSPEDADIILLSSLTAISSILPRYSGIYGGRRHFANLFNVHARFIVCVVACGFGRPSFAEAKIMPLCSQKNIDIAPIVGVMSICDIVE
jgi:hypothetical protein